MSGNSNYTPLGASKPWLRDANSSAIPGTSSESSAPILPGQQIGVHGEVLARAAFVTGACTKCGYVGHLPFQCRNFIQIKPNQKTDIDVSSTSSEEYTTPLTSKEERKKLKKLKKREKKELKRLEKKIKKELKEKSKRKRKYSTSSSESRTSDSSESGRRKHRKRDKEKSKKKKDKKRRKSPASNSR